MGTIKNNVMKNYCKNVPIYNAGNHTAPLYFEPRQEEPKSGDNVALIFNHEGKYLGWVAPERFQKYMYGQLYYRSNRKYSISTTTSRRSRRKDIIVKERTSGKTCLWARVGMIYPEDLVDRDNINDTVGATITRVRELQITIYNFLNYPDPYGLIDKDFTTKFQKEFYEMVSRQRQEVIEFLEAKKGAHNGLAELGNLRASILG